MHSRRSFRLGVLLASAILTLLCFHRTLGYGFTDRDTLMHVAEGRVDSAGDLARLLVTPLAGGRAQRDANFYRPSMMLTFAGLRAAFGWSPLGYHVFDLALHALNGLLVVLFAAACAARAGAARPEHFGLACGLIFVLHPATVEIVPAVARNSDLVVTALSLGALVSLDRIVTRSTPLRLAVFYGLVALTLGAKEPGALVLVAGFFYVAWLCRAPARAIRLLAPALGLACVYFAIRAVVLGDTWGGYGLDHPLWFLALAVPSWMLSDLVVPGYAHRLSELPGIELRLHLRWLILAAFALLALAWVGKRSLSTNLLRPVPRLLLYASTVVLAYTALFVLAGAYERRYLYALLPYAAFFPAAFFAYSIDWVGRPARAVALVTCLAAALLLLFQSPLIHRYDEWRSSGEATRLLTVELQEQWSELPDGATVVFANLPSGFSVDPMRHIMGAGVSSTNSPALHSIQAWLEDRFPEKRIELRTLGYYRYRVPLGSFRHRFQRLRGAISFLTPPGEMDLDQLSYVGLPFRTRKQGERRLLLTRRPRSKVEDLHLLVFDGVRPVIVPARV